MLAGQSVEIGQPEAKTYVAADKGSVGVSTVVFEIQPSLKELQLPKTIPTQNASFTLANVTVMGM